MTFVILATADAVMRGENGLKGSTPFHFASYSLTSCSTIMLSFCRKFLKKKWQMTFNEPKNCQEMGKEMVFKKSAFAIPFREV